MGGGNFPKKVKDTKKNEYTATVFYFSDDLWPTRFLKLLQRPKAL